MAKITRTRTRIKRSVVYTTYLVIAMMIVASLMCQIFLRSYNDSLAVKNQKKQDEILRLKNENELIKQEIQKLISQDRIFKVAQSNNLKINQDNAVVVRE